MKSITLGKKHLFQRGLIPIGVILIDIDAFKTYHSPTQFVFLLRLKGQMLKIIKALKPLFEFGLYNKLGKFWL